MIPTVRRLLILAFGAICAPSAWTFRRALRDPARAQAAARTRITRAIADTAWGREHGVLNAADWERLPIVTWDDLSGWLERDHHTPNTVVPGRVRMYERTSGSTGPVKLVPYNTGLFASFARMFRIWCADLIWRGPRLETGRLFFSISPHFDDAAATGAGVPVGLDDDAGYIDGWLLPFVRPFFVAPSGLARERDPEVFFTRLAEALVLDGDLEVISVWNPTFLTVIQGHIARNRRWADRLSPERADALRADPINWERLWPRLRLISTWASGNAALQQANLRRDFPTTLIQPKGLLMTEAPVTIPLIGHPGGAPLVDEVVIELEDDDGRVHPIERAPPSGRFRLIISQVAGLVRYRTGDVVEVVGRIYDTPLLEFVGRDATTSDLVGEKLYEAFVRDVFVQLGLDDRYAALTPSVTPHARYILRTDRPAPEDLAGRLDEALSAAHHYRHARRMAQLGPVEIDVDPAWPTRLLALSAPRGREGGQKHRILWTHPVD